MCVCVLRVCDELWCVCVVSIHEGASLHTEAYNIVLKLNIAKLSSLRVSVVIFYYYYVRALCKVAKFHNPIFFLTRKSLSEHFTAVWNNLRVII